MSKRVRVQYDEGSDGEREERKKKKMKEVKMRKRQRMQGDTLIKKIDGSPIDKEVLDSIYKKEFHEIYTVPNFFIGIVTYEDHEEICIYEEREGDFIVHTTAEVIASGRILLNDIPYRLVHLLIWTYRFLGKEVPLYVRFRNGNKKDLSTNNISFAVCRRRPADLEYKNFTLHNKITGESFTADTINEISMRLGINPKGITRRLSGSRHYLGWQIFCNDHQYCVENALGERKIVNSTKELSKFLILICYIYLYPSEKYLKIKKKSELIRVLKEGGVIGEYIIIKQ